MADKKATLAEKQGALKNAQDKLAKAQQIVDAIEAEIARQKAEDEAKAEKAKRDAEIAHRKAEAKAHKVADKRNATPSIKDEGTTQVASRRQEGSQAVAQATTTRQGQAFTQDQATTTRQGQAVAQATTPNAQHAPEVDASSQSQVTPVDGKQAGLPYTGMDATHGLTVAGVILLAFTALAGIFAYMRGARKNK